MTQATWNRGLIVVWTAVLGMTSVGGITLAVLGPPKPMRTVTYSIDAPTAEADEKQTVERFQPTNPTTPKPPIAGQAGQLPLVGESMATTAPADSNTAIGHMLFNIASIAVDELAKPQTVITAPLLAVDGSALAAVPQAEHHPGDQPPSGETPASNNLDADPISAFARAEPTDTPPAPPITGETRPSSAAAASVQNFKFRIRGNAPHEARTGELTRKLRSDFSRNAEWQSETQAPATAVIRYPAAVDHATALDVGHLVGSVGYAWRIEKLPAQFTERTIDIWLPDAKRAPTHHTANEPHKAAPLVPPNKLIWSPSELPPGPSSSVASGYPSDVLNGYQASVPVSRSDPVSANVSASSSQPSATVNAGDIY